MCPRDTDGMANNVDPDQSGSSLIRVYAVCLDLSVPKLRNIIVNPLIWIFQKAYEQEKLLSLWKAQIT